MKDIIFNEEFKMFDVSVNYIMYLYNSLKRRVTSEEIDNSVLIKNEDYDKKDIVNIIGQNVKGLQAMIGDSKEQIKSFVVNGCNPFSVTVDDNIYYVACNEDLYRLIKFGEKEYKKYWDDMLGD